MKNKAVDCFQAISDKNRRDILIMLSKKKQNINAIADNFSISRPAISKHIKVLHSAGFITIKETGRDRYCELNPNGFEDIKKWITFFENYWNKKLSKLEAFLNDQSLNKKVKKGSKKK